MSPNQDHLRHQQLLLPQFLHQVNYIFILTPNNFNFRFCWFISSRYATARDAYKYTTTKFTKYSATKFTTACSTTNPNHSPTTNWCSSTNATYNGSPTNWYSANKCAAKWTTAYDATWNATIPWISWDATIPRNASCSGNAFYATW